MRISDWSSDVCSSDLIAGFAVDAVLRVDLQAWRSAVVVAHDLVDAGRAIALRRLVVEPEVVLDRNARGLQRQVDRRVLLMVGVGDEHRGELFGDDDAVGGSDERRGGKEGGRTGRTRGS